MTHNFSHFKRHLLRTCVYINMACQKCVRVCNQCCWDGQSANVIAILHFYSIFHLSQAVGENIGNDIDSCTIAMRISSLWRFFITVGYWCPDSKMKQFLAISLCMSYPYVSNSLLSISLSENSQNAKLRFYCQCCQ